MGDPPRLKSVIITIPSNNEEFKSISGGGGVVEPPLTRASQPRAELFGRVTEAARERVVSPTPILAVWGGSPPPHCSHWAGRINAFKIGTLAVLPRPDLCPCHKQGPGPKIIPGLAMLAPAPAFRLVHSSSGPAVPGVLSRPQPGYSGSHLPCV
ncbi:hypothetical protein KIL84_021287 [Mauremys mutica]|uniref:Uncharacterized protein n=1 Tax=Mauremys mutica TaxID=74926 RepID=A0A9D3XBB8_9SAUR|nr:hypothetical protein KIL84_021287 [Mauremys mutica]